MRPGAVVFQPVGLLADVVDEGLRIDGGDAVDETGRGQDARREARELLWDPPEYCTLVVLIANANAGCRKLFTFVA